MLRPDEARHVKLSPRQQLFTHTEGEGHMATPLIRATSMSGPCSHALSPVTHRSGKLVGSVRGNVSEGGHIREEVGTHINTIDDFSPQGCTICIHEVGCHHRCWGYLPCFIDNKPGVECCIAWLNVHAVAVACCLLEDPSDVHLVKPCTRSSAGPQSGAGTPLLSNLCMEPPYQRATPSMLTAHLHVW